MLTKTKLLACSGLLTLCAAAAAPTAGAAPLSPVREYDVRLSVAMKGTFSFAPDPTGCNGRSPDGFTGSGQELLEASSPKPVRVSVIAFPGQGLVVNRKDGRSAFELKGVTRRTGSMSWQSCRQALDPKCAPCLGTHRIDAAAELRFQPRDRFRAQDTMKQTAHGAVPACGNSAFGWNRAVARTGIILLNDAFGSAAKLRRTGGAFTLTATARDTCDATQFGTGTCGSQWTWKARFTPVKAKRRR